VTFRLHPADLIELIFHRGAKVRDDAAEFSFADDSGLIRWITPERGGVTFRDEAEAREREAELVSVALRWMRATT